MVTVRPGPAGIDDSSFFELMHEADANATARPLIAELMVSKFRVPEKLIRLDHSDRYPAISVDAITIIEVPTIRLFLKHFGRLVRRLRFTNSYMLFTPDDVQVLAGDIEQFTAATLAHIELISVGNRLISDTTHQFPAVAHVQLYSTHFNSAQFALNRIYPAMESLKVIAHQPENLTALVRTYPHLKRLEFEEYGDRLYGNYVKDLVASNAQLQSLQVNTLPTVEFLEFLRDTATGLKSLAFRCNDFDPIHEKPIDRFVHFANVTELQLSQPYACPAPFPMSFGHLDSVTLSFGGTVKEFLVRRLLANNDKVTAVSMPFADPSLANFRTTLMLLHILRDLETVELQWSQQITPAETRRLMKEFGALRKVVFRVAIGSNAAEFEAIEWPAEWEIGDVQTTQYQKVYTVSAVKDVVGKVPAHVISSLGGHLH